MSIFGHTIPSAAGVFPLSAWLRATTTGQPGAFASGITWTGGNGVGRWGLSIENGRALFIVPNSSGYAAMQVATPAGVGTAQIPLSTSTNVIDLVQVPDNPRYFLALLNNDVYLLDCGVTGNTLTVTQINTVAGDAGKAEAFVAGVTKIMIDAADHFTIINEFNNGGTRSWVSALFTLDLGGVTATYVSRDVDATGSAAALQSTIVINSSTLGTGLALGINGTDTTTTRACKVAHTTSTVTNTLTNLSGFNHTSISSVARYINARYPSEDLIVLRSGDLGAVIEFSGTPQVLSIYTTSGSQIFAGGPTEAFVDDMATDAVYGTQGTANTTFAVTFGSIPNGIFTAKTRDLITGLTASVAIGATVVDPNGEYIYAAGKTSTNTGQVFVVKNADV